MARLAARAQAGRMRNRKYKEARNPGCFDRRGNPTPTRNQVISVIVSIEERQACIAAAQASGMSLSAWMRERAFAGSAEDEGGETAETDPELEVTADSGPAIIDT